jgi:bifunctional UDP-N-acetylglucosamine pyrophosphorylase/glucosamine-1-phosphate N-acetyltransferase
MRSGFLNSAGRQSVEVEWPPDMAGWFQRPLFDETSNRERIARLRERGVEVWGPERVYIGPDVPLEAVEPGAVLINAIITGEHVGIGTRSRIGISGNATIHNCQLGERVEIGAGLFDSATLLDDAKVRGFAEFREGTLLEEQAEVGHNVGLKKTVLTVAVVAGSLINFCDVFMTGGTSRLDHSEIGSGTVHFNFDPRGDKFGSLIGDATGILLRSSRIFVGGNCGLVAPLHLGFGSVLAAGSTLRRDLAQSQLSYGETSFDKTGHFDPEVYYDLRHKVFTTAKLIGAMHAVRAWYRMVRIAFADTGRTTLYQSAEQRIATHMRHRVNELKKVILKLDRSLSKQAARGLDNPFEKQHRLLLEKEEKICQFLSKEDESDFPPLPHVFVEDYGHQRLTLSHVDALRNLTKESASQAAGWIQEIAANPLRKMEDIFHNLQS